jgi:broad specificity phosphatase PhoE
MSTPRPEVWLIRHGETEWSRTHKHTGVTDVPLTDAGEAAAAALAPGLAGVRFDLVLTSPLSRARETARLAGFPDAAPEPDAQEVHYGEYEGVTTATIRETVPGWTVWTHPTPGGETFDAVAARADRVIERLAAVPERSLLFAHGHFLRILIARWIGLAPTGGGLFQFQTSTIAMLAHERENRVLERLGATPG